MKRIIIHAHEMNDWQIIFNGLHLVHTADDAIELVILADGEAVHIVEDDDLLETVREWQNKGTVFEVCAHALSEEQLTKEVAEAQAFVVVANSYIELMNRQNDGYAYIRA